MSKLYAQTRIIDKQNSVSPHLPAEFEKPVTTNSKPTQHTLPDPFLEIIISGHFISYES